MTNKSKVMLQFLLPAFVLINAWTMFRFWQDKMRAAINGERRIPEADLLSLAIIGGTVGAFLGRHIFRHKTRKEPFSTYLQTILVMQIGAMIGFWLL